MKYLTKLLIPIFVLFNLSFSQDFDISQSQQQAVYLIDTASFEGVEIDSEDYILARTSEGTLVGARQYDGYGSELMVMGQDLDIVVNDETYVLCEETGTCGYPQEGDNVYLSIYDTSQGQEFVPYFFSPAATQQTVVFSPLINEGFISINVLEDCSDTLGGTLILDECGQCGGSGIHDGEYQESTGHEIIPLLQTVPPPPPPLFWPKHEFI